MEGEPPWQRLPAPPSLPGRVRLGHLSGVPSRCEIERLHGGRLVEVDDRVELLRKAGLEVVAGPLGLGSVDHADGALEARLARSLGQERMLTYLTGAFGLTALALACLGLYGTISYAVTRRTPELGVRMALGADRSAVRRLIMGEALTLVLLGLGIGLPLAFVAARALKGILFGVSALDVPSYAGAVGVLLAIATLAAYVPARRASRLDPVSALRAE